MRTIAQIACALLLAMLLLTACGPPPPVSTTARAASSAPSSIEDIPTIIIAQELAARGIVKWGCAEAGVATGTWNPPTDGSPALLYSIHLEYYGVAPDTFFVWPIPAWADSVRARVAGIDAQGRQGEWSLWSWWLQLLRAFKK